jgi:DNA-binding transcriptional LysR family regulator
MRLPQPIPDLAALDLLVSVAERGSINEAAALHFITQPAASMRLGTLEKVLGLQLLDRTPTGSRLTPAGAATVEWARSILDDMRALIVGTAALRGEGGQRLRLAASLTVAEYLVPGWLQSLAASQPGVAVALQMGNSTTVIDLVNRNEAELGFIEGPRLPRGLRHKDLGDDGLVIVVAPSHPWARRRSVPTHDVANAPLLLREEGSGTRDVLSDALAAHDLAVRPLVELASTTAIKAAACAGNGVAVLSRLAVDDELRAGRLVTVACPELELSRRIRAIWASARPLSPPAKDLLSIVSAWPRPRSPTNQRAPA